MTFQCVLAVLLMWTCVLAGCRKAPPIPQPPPVSEADTFEPKAAQPKLPAIKLWLGSEEINSEMATSREQVMTGMMFRTNMAESDSMIFVLPYTQRAGFWMKNCFVPLSVAYIDPQGVIQEIHNLEPHNTNTVESASDNIRFALEVPQGWFARHHIREGTLIRSERGSLMQTFNQQP